MCEKKKTSAWKSVLFSNVLVGKSKSRKIAYIAVMAALNIAVNAMASIPLGFVQFSLTIFISVLTGILIGPLFGFAACFLGDTLGYIVGNGGANGWTPWIGLATALTALVAGFIVNGFSWKFKGAWIVKLALTCVVTFLISTVAINTTAMYWMWYKKTFDSWWAFLITRLFVQGQIWNSVLNYGLLFFVLPALEKIKPLKITL